MDLSDAIAFYEDRRNRLRLRVDEAQAGLQRALAELSAVDDRLRALTESAEELREVGPPTIVKAQVAEATIDWVGLDRTEAVLAVLARSISPMSPAQVQEELVRLGRNDGYDVVGSTLAHLKRTGRVEQPSRGRYTLPLAKRLLKTIEDSAMAFSMLRRTSQAEAVGTGEEVNS